MPHRPAMTPKTPPKPEIATQIGPPTHHKILLRQQLLAVRSVLEAEQRAQWDLSIGLQLQMLCAQQSITRLGVYWPIRSEPDLRASYTILHQSGVELLLPVVLERDAPLQFVPWMPGSAMVRDLCGVPVPANQPFQAPPAALLIPCVGFNRMRFRLGYGAGFYDRTLAKIPSLYTIGVAYSCLEAEFEAAQHDIALKKIITEVR
jgi:5-formyltetrahydrofolate cyclo-ligase